MIEVVTKTYIRKPFPVEAVQITEENIDDIAAIIGEVVVNEKGIRLIKLNRELIPRMSHAYIGWYVTRMGPLYRCYKADLFESQYVLHEGNTLFSFPTQEIAEQPVTFVLEEDLEGIGISQGVVERTPEV